MKTRVLGPITLMLGLAAAAFGQGTVVITDPTVTVKESTLSTVEHKAFDRTALPRLKAKFLSDACTVEPEFAGVVAGSFTRAGADQRLAFLQVCQTGNGLGIVGLVLFEEGKVTGLWAADSGWSQDITVLPDINGNKLNEFTLAFGGGMHQGQGGVGIDIMEFAAGRPKGLGWFKAEAFTEEDVTAWKVTAKPGAAPAYFKQKYTQVSENKWRRVGAVTPLKLTKAYGTFEAVK